MAKQSLVKQYIFLDFQWLEDLQGGTGGRNTEPHNARFPINDLFEKFARALPLGIFPCSLLNNKFRYLRYESNFRDLWITPESLLLDISKNSKLINSPNNFRIGPRKFLCLKLRICKSLSSPMVDDRSLDKWFLDKSLDYQSLMEEIHLENPMTS